MITSVSLDAHWALYGKHPGTLKDYSVLAASSLFSRDEYASIISHFSIGTPPTQRSSVDGLLSSHRSPGDLPWIILNWAGRDDELHLGIAIQRATADVDGVGRQIAETSCFFVSYAALAERPVSFSDLYEVVKDLRLPREDGAPIALPRVPLLDREEMARRIAAIGERPVSLVADRLLSGPVTIVKADGSSPTERLQFLDAVASMLPYGYRTRFAASTWSDSGVRHRMRLAFAERRNAGAEAYLWRSEPDSVQLEPGSYLAQLERLRGRSGHSLKKFELPFIIGHLAASTTARRFDQPRFAVDCLADIDLPFGVLSDVRAGQAEEARVRDLFAGDRVLELPAGWRLEVFGELVSYADPADWARITHWWNRISSVDPPAMLPALATACRRRLWTATPDVDYADKLVGLTAGDGMADSLLSRVIAPPERSQAFAGGLLSVALVLYKWILEGGRYENFTLSRSALSRNPALACEVAAEIGIMPGRGKTQKIEWLQQVMPGLAPFAGLIGGDSRPVTANTISQLALADIRCVGSLLRMADHCRRLGQVLPALLWWLGCRSDIELQARDLIGGQIRVLSPRTAEQAADADLALLAVGHQITFMRNCTTSQDTRRYSRRFAQQWNAIVQYNGNDRQDPFTAAFAITLDSGTWADQPLSARVIIDICELLASRDGKPRFRSLVASVLNATYDAQFWPFAVNWMKDFHNQQAVAKSTAGSLARLPANTPPEHIGALCYRAFVNQVPAKSAGSALAHSEALNQAPSINDVLSAVRSVFWADPPSADRGPLRRILTAVFASDQDRLRGWIDDVVKAAITARGRLAAAAAKSGPARQDNERG